MAANIGRGKPPYLRTPGSGRPGTPERTELGQAFGRTVRTPQKALTKRASSAGTYALAPITSGGRAGSITIGADGTITSIVRPR